MKNTRGLGYPVQAHERVEDRDARQKEPSVSGAFSVGVPGGELPDVLHAYRSDPSLDESINGLEAQIKSLLTGLRSRRIIVETNPRCEPG
jgi:hypothetical protein